MFRDWMTLGGFEPTITRLKVLWTKPLFDRAWVSGLKPDLKGYMKQTIKLIKHSLLFIY